MKNSILSLRASWTVTTAAGLLFSVAASAADFPGYAKVEDFDGINGGNIADLTAAAKYINNQPDSVTFVNSLYYSRTPGADNYGTRISGFLTPTETAEYVFLVAADDSCSLYLSTDADPVKLKLIAADQGWQNSRTWIGPGDATSGAGTDTVIFRRGFNPGPAVLATNNFEWVPQQAQYRSPVPPRSRPRDGTGWEILTVTSGPLLSLPTLGRIRSTSGCVKTASILTSSF